MSLDNRLKAPRRTRVGSWCLLLVFSTLVLLPAIQTGYILEDGVHSLFRGMMRFHGDGFWGRVRYFVACSFAQGRFYPITQLLHTSVHYLATGVVSYKCCLLIATIVDVLLFWILVRRATGSHGLAFLVGVLTVGLYQLRIHFDPVLGFYLQFQLILAGQFLSLLALQSFLEGRGNAWLAVSALAYLVILLTYEICYTFFLMQWLLILKERMSWRRRVGLAAPFVLLAFGCGMATAWVRSNATADHYVQHLEFDLGSNLEAYWYQVSAALPMSYLWGDPHDLFGEMTHPSRFLRWWLQPVVIAMIIGTLGAVHLVLRRERDEEVARPPHAHWAIVGIGVLLVALPPLMVSTSPFHRRFFALGLGWAHVLIQCHGVGLLLAIAIWTLLSRQSLGGRFGRWKCLVAGLAVAASTGVTFRTNLEVVSQFNRRTEHYVRQNLEASLHAGLLDEVPEYSILHLAHEYGHWHDTIGSLYFYSHHNRKRVIPVSVQARVADSPESQTLGEHLAGSSMPIRTGSAHTIYDMTLGPRSGYVWLAPIGEDLGITRLFVRTPHLFRKGSAPAFLLVADLRGVDGSLQERKYILLGENLTRIRAGRDWAIFSLPPEARAVEPTSLRLVFDPMVARAMLQSEPDHSRRFSIRASGSTKRLFVTMEANASQTSHRGVVR